LLFVLLAIIRTGLQALALKAQYEAACAGGTTNPNEQQIAILDELKTLAGSGGEPNATAQLAAAQTCLMAGEPTSAYPFVADGGTSEHRACKVQILLRLDRLDLAKRELELMRASDDGDEAILTELASVYIRLYEGSGQASEAEHTVNTLSEQYGPSVFLLNLLASALAVQGDYAAAETKLNEALRDYAEIQPQHETILNLIAVYQQQNKVAEAAQLVEELLAQSSPATPVSLAFAENLHRVTAAFDREAIKYKV
jgi:coatomer subunit epsilon